MTNEEWLRFIVIVAVFAVVVISVMVFHPPRTPILVVLKGANSFELRAGTGHNRCVVSMPTQGVAPWLHDGTEIFLDHNSSVYSTYTGLELTGWVLACGEYKVFWEKATK